MSLARNGNKGELISCVSEVSVSLLQGRDSEKQQQIRIFAFASSTALSQEGLAKSLAGCMGKYGCNYSSADNTTEISSGTLMQF